MVGGVSDAIRADTNLVELTQTTAIALMEAITMTAGILRQCLGPTKCPLYPQVLEKPTLSPTTVASLDWSSEQKEIWVVMEQMDAEVVETVAGVARLLRRAAELAWMQADAAGPRSSRQVLALGIDSAADEAWGLLPRRARLDGPTPVGNDPTELLVSAEQLLRRICVVGTPARLLGLRVLLAELVWEVNTDAGA
jgi:hypothetical protein